MLFDIFKKNKSEKGTPLKYYIPNCKTYSGNDLFVTIYNDLDTDSFKDDVFAMMTYAYARRTIASFLYLQGHFNKEEIEYQQVIFKSLQNQTNASYEFQEDTAAASLDFLQEYSSWFTKIKIGSAVGAVISGNVVDNKSLGIQHSDDAIKNLVSKISAQNG
jgi:hypothetical protein